MATHCTPKPNASDPAGPIWNRRLYSHNTQLHQFPSKLSMLPIQSVSSSPLLNASRGPMFCQSMRPNNSGLADVLSRWPSDQTHVDLHTNPPHISTGILDSIKGANTDCYSHKGFGISHEDTSSGISTKSSEFVQVMQFGKCWAQSERWERGCTNL